MENENRKQGKARNRKEFRETLSKKNIQGMQKWKVILLYFVIVGFATFLMVGYADMKMSWIQEDGSQIAEEIFSTMQKGEKLPWSSENNKVLAVIQCDNEEPIFVTEKDFFGSEVANCTYHLAKNTEVVFASKKFKTEGIFKFQPKASE